MNRVTKRVRKWNNKTRKLVVGGAGENAADVIKIKYGDQLPVPRVINADTFKQYRMYKSYKQVGEVWEMRNMSVEAPELFVHDGYLYVKHLKQGNKTHVKYLRMPYEPEVLEPEVMEPQVMEPEEIDKAMFKKLRMYIGNNGIWELRNPEYFDDPPKQFVYNMYLYTLLPEDKQKNKTHKKYKQTIFEPKAPKSEEPTAPKAPPVDVEAPKAPTAEAPPTEAEAQPVDVEAPEAPMAPAAEPPDEAPIDTTIHTNPVKSLSDIEEQGINTISPAEYKKLRMYKAPTNKGDIWEMRNKEYFDHPLEKFIFDGYLYELLEKQGNKTHKKYARQELKLLPEEALEEVPAEVPAEALEEVPAEVPEEAQAEAQEEVPEEENYPDNSVESQEELQDLLSKQKIQTVDTNMFKKLKMHKAPSKKDDIWEMRNKDYFNNPLEKFVFEGYLYELLIKQGNKTHKKYVRKPIVDLPSVPAQQPSTMPLLAQSNLDHNLVLNYKSHSGKTEKITGLDDFLYPSLDDPDLSQKIAVRKEFSAFKYDGKIADIKTLSDKLCANPEFELMPHQLFVKNFLSKNTPYNSILLYHGLGSGKTCSAIGIAEEMRATMKQTGSNQRIMVIASTNVQDNFRLQLFDERKLGNRSIESCIGSSLLREINPTNDTSVEKDKIIMQANSIINASYSFMGYMQLANYIQNKVIVKAADYTDKQRRDMEIANIKRIFNNRLIIIDEVHNIPGKTVAPLLLYVAKHADNLRFVLLSATPMYNSVEEIVYLTNLMNINDGRPTIKPSEVFDMQTGQMTVDGRKLLQKRLNGYVSYVRGENPYTFPFRLYPDVFEPQETFVTRAYPKNSLTGRPNVPPMMGMKNRIYLTQMGSEQEIVYKFIADHIFTRASSTNIFSRQHADDDETLFENMESFGYTKLQVPIQACIMTFPLTKPVDDDPDETQQAIKKMVGKEGLSNAMKYKEEKKKIDEETTIFMKHAFEYKKGYEGIFSLDGRLRQCSGKIAKICDKILVSQGIIIVYSQYIDGGIVPMALALEELGFSRYGSMQQFVKPLFKKGAALNQEPRDAETMLLRPDFLKTNSADAFKQAKYMILSGDKFFSQNNAEDIKYATNKANIYGHNIRVILISKAASEGLDFKYVRQVHVLDPWYNMNRIEQIVGRGVRNMSHCGLPFEERNVEVYLHASLSTASEEVADHYIYRYAETKAITIGKVTRLLKEVSVDCVLNIGQSNFTDVQLASIAANKDVKVKSSSKPDTLLHIRIGDKTGTEACDYSDSCTYTCVGQPPATNQIVETYGTEYLQSNSERLLEKTKELYRNSKKVYTKYEIWKSLNIDTEEQLNYVLERLLDETVEDDMGRAGRVINRGHHYMFQPIEISDTRANLLEVSMPVDFKHDKLKFKITETSQQQNELLSDKSPVSPTDAAMGNKSLDLILSEIDEHMATVNDPVAHVLEPGEKDWAKNLNSGRLIKHHLIDKHGLSRSQISQYAFDHIMDTLHYREKRSIVEGIQSGAVTDGQIIEYFNKRRLDSGNGKSYGYLLARVNKGVVKNVFLLYEGNTWLEEEPGDMVSYKQLLTQRFGKEVDKFNSLMGFMGYFKGRGTTWSMVFKTKMMNIGKNNKGAYLLNEGKSEILKKYNALMDEIRGNKATIDDVADLNKIGVGLVVEILIRHYNEMRVNGKIWTLTAEEALYNGVENI